jgi:glycosyltransferase involved in cell wall biosynthesis
VITFCIPFYSNQDYLKKAVQSVLRQSSPAWHLIVVDDFSHEGLDGSIARYLEGLCDERVSYVRNENNLGLAGNWNRCLEVAETDLVTIFHADDELDSCYVERFFNLSEQYSEAVAYFCKASIIDGESKPVRTVADSVKAFFDRNDSGITKVSGVAGLAKLLRANTIVCPTVCYRKSVLLGERFSLDLRMVLDMEFTTRNLLLGRSLIGTSEKLYRYRRHSLNATNELSKSLVRSREECWLWNWLGDELTARGADSEAQIAYRKTIVKLTLMFYIAMDLMRFDLKASYQKILFFPRLWQCKPSRPRLVVSK